MRSFSNYKSANDFIVVAKCPSCGHEIAKKKNDIYSLTVCEKCGVIDKFKAIGGNVNKYGNKRTEYKGSIYASKLEATQAYELDVLQQAGEIKSWEAQVRESLEAYGEKIGEYWPDFRVIHNDESVEYIETKGKQTDLYRWKKKMFLAKYKKKLETGEIVFNEVFAKKRNKIKLFKKCLKKS